MTSPGLQELKPVLETLPETDELFDKCLELGLVMHRPPGVVSHVGMSLIPYRMRRDVLQELFRRQTLWNEAVDRTARDFSFLHRALRSVSTTDTKFTGRLVRLLEEVYLDDEPVAAGRPKKVYQKLMLGILRSDYMHAIDEEGEGDRVERWKHVEINTISCSFAGLAPLVGDFHDYLRLHRGVLRGGNGDEKEAGKIERSTSGVAIPAALAQAVRAWMKSIPLEEFSRRYAAKEGGGNRDLLPVVLVVAQEGERNVADVRKLLFELLNTYRIPSIRRTLRELHESMELIPSHEANPPFAVVEKHYVAAVVYFRSTYIPADLPDDAAWQTRTALERSNAIKCPSLPYHLMTFKKIQQLLCDRAGVLAPIGFAGNEEKAATLSAHFMPQFSLNVEEYLEGNPEEIIQAAVDHPEEFVLKPQLEGGGNIFHGEQMQRLLRDTPVEDPEYMHIRKEYILMRKIHSPKETAALFREKTITPLAEDALSELGIYGVVLSNGEGFALNEAAGYVIRTKPASTQDGGVMAGNACLSSLLVL
ncbi:unnamed protein product [Phytomonas sp. EM1]|nr:unnamed protein product [Phytomonas sp. EM1]|eukprot:CCW64254.1 unnamed protein product [Phytomonas sp. isolate EM1]